MSVVTVPLAKTKVKSSIEVETDSLHEDVYREALILGLKVLLTRGTTELAKITDEAERKAGLEKIAAENLEKCKEGKIRFTSGSAKTKGIPAAVKTEAMRLARAYVKDALKADGKKISHYSAGEITEAAKVLLEDDASLIEQAKANLEARAATPIKINLSFLKEDPELVKKAEEKKAKSKASGLSAKQASIPAKRKGGKPAEATAH